MVTLISTRLSSARTKRRRPRLPSAKTTPHQTWPGLVGEGRTRSEEPGGCGSPQAVIGQYQTEEQAFYEGGGRTRPAGGLLRSGVLAVGGSTSMSKHRSDR